MQCIQAKSKKQKAAVLARFKGNNIVQTTRAVPCFFLRVLA
jgi:hypothetical protein